MTDKDQPAGLILGPKMACQKFQLMYTLGGKAMGKIHASIKDRAMNDTAGHILV